ncbi:XRE family transcriptional regulator [Alsobacter sp. SYSU M60028]|uniref:XRE family transcriptional regulator n=1 Tax=Alsobacter ponti TaxID=2962936 RepID=A0ABT1LEC6_9HYPH|nr:XRE family transcriptional regulator [Alsobacter ponti]MCP8939839.1 XRE family transcriptional regulator [Alsobacter ponti]
MNASPAASTDRASRPKVGAAIRSRRRQVGMTLQALCDAAGISVGYLSQVERDLATPSLGTLAQIAQALDVGVDYFIATPSVEDAITRAGQRERFQVDGSSCVYERIAADFAGNVLSSFVMTVPPGFRSETVSHEGEEIVYVIEGAITQTVDGEAVALRAGDSMHFRGNRPHAWANETNAPARLLWTGTLALFRPRAAKIAGKTATKDGGGTTKTSTRTRRESPK